MRAPSEVAARVAFLTNFVPPYRRPVLEELAAGVGSLRVLVSTAMEANRSWTPEWAGLDVVVQKGLTLPRRWRHPAGFRERLPLHIPLDTLRQLDAFDPDLVLSAEMGARSLLAGRWCRRQRRPLLLWATLSERTELGRGRLRWHLRRHLLDRAAAVIVNGESGARYIRSFGYPDDRIHRVNQASPIGAAAGAAGAAAQDAAAADAGAYEADGSPLRLLYVGLLVERKGLRGVIAALRDWCDRVSSPAELTLVGEGPLAEELRAAETGGQLRVRVVGPVAFDELERRYRAADLLVFPTLADEWGLVVNEAMACGLPVLGSVHSQAVLELVEEGRTGWLYDPEQPGELEAALDRVAAAGRTGVRRAGAAARERVRPVTPRAMAEQLLGAVRDVLREAPAGDAGR